MNRRKSLSAIATALAAGLFGVALPQAASAAEVTLTYAFFAPAKTFPARQMTHWAEQLAKRTNGKVDVKTFPGGTLLGAKDMYDGVTKGVADIGLGSPSYDPGRFPLTSGVALPVGFTTATQASRTLWALTKEFKPKEYEGFKVIAMFTTEPGFIQTKTAVRNAADLAGMKLRAAGTGVPVLKALGAAPIGMPMPEVPQSVSTGVINGTMTSREVLQDFKLAESLKFVTDYPTVVVAFAAVMDQKKWDKLPADVKKVIEELAEEMPGWTGNYHDNENVGAAMAWATKEHKLQVVSLAADERAPTPTAAAQRVAPDRHALLRSLRDTAQHLERAQRNRLQTAMQSLDYLQRRLVHPAQQLQRRAQQLDQLQQRLQRAFAYRKQQQHWQWQSLAQRLRAAGSDFARLRDQQGNLAQRLAKAMCTAQAQRIGRVDNLAQHLILLDPKQVLARGYSMVQDANGAVVSDAGQIAVGAELRITFAKGWARSEVKEKGGL